MPSGVYERKSLEIRFWEKVNKTETCWLWTGPMNRYGYGMFKVQEKNVSAHRVSWLLAGNTIPEGNLIRHKCRNRHCVNPEHLETGTQTDNMRDKVRDGTTPNFKGINHPRVELTEVQVREIRARYTENQRELAKEYGISQGTIGDIIHRRTWSHLE
jgi:hypothetical protein